MVDNSKIQELIDSINNLSETIERMSCNLTDKIDGGKMVMSESEKTKRRIHRRLIYGIKGGKQKTPAEDADILGCSYAEANDYIKSLFKPGMTWENHGKWHFDHIKPCCKFDFTKTDQIKQCFNIYNIQPIWAHENFDKGSYYPIEISKRRIAQK